MIANIEMITFHPFCAIAGVRTVIANWQVRYASTLLHLL